MAVSGSWYASGLNAFLSGTLDWDANTFKIALYTNADSPDTTTDTTYSSTNEVAAGGGYTQDSKTLTTTTVTTVQDGSATAAAISTAYEVGDVVRPSAANGYVYRCVVAGTSSGTPPTWPTVVGQTVADGTVTWLNAGTAFIKLDAADVQWASSTITARYAKIYQDTTNQLVALIDFGQDESSSNGNFDIVFHPDGIVHIFLH